MYRRAFVFLPVLAPDTSSGLALVASSSDFFIDVLECRHSGFVAAVTASRIMLFRSKNHQRPNMNPE
jgi:hypothetical protein